MRPPRLRCTLFPLIYPPHLLVLPATLGLHLFWQTYPYFRALYVISVRRTKSLLTASFRFHLTMDTLAVLLYTSSLPRRVRDFHPLERAHGAQTKKNTVNSVFLEQGMRESNSHQKFWRLLSYHLTNPLYIIVLFQTINIITYLIHFCKCTFKTSYRFRVYLVKPSID